MAIFVDLTSSTRRNLDGFPKIGDLSVYCSSDMYCQGMVVVQSSLEYKYYSLCVELS